MKKIHSVILVLSITAIAISTKAQTKLDSSKSKFIQPLIISTDVFAPLSIGVEKVFNENHSIKLRLFKLYPEGATGIVDDKSLSSLMMQYKYYPKKVKPEDFNIYAGFYSKYRRGISETKLTNQYGQIAGNSEQINQSLFFGLQGGLHLFIGKLSFDGNAGMGVNTF